MENVKKNHLEDKISVLQGDVTEGLGFQADIIVANLIADLIVRLTEDIARHLTGKKIFISSGILSEKKEIVTEALEKSGFCILDILEEEGWCAIAAKLS